MSRWSTKPFREIFKLKQGKYLTKDEMVETPRGDWAVPVYGANGIIGYTNRLMYDRPVPLVSCRGANCGVTHLTQPKSWISNNSIACVSDDADPRFFFHVFRITSFADVTGGSAQPQITLSSLGPKQIVCPPLETQRRIASILGAYDDLIEVNRRRIVVLEEMARGLFEEWFVRFRFPGHEAVPILDTPDGPMPEGWKQATVSEAFELLRGRSYRSAELADEGGMPFVNLKCMDRDGGFRVSGLKRFTGDFKPHHAVVRGDIVLAVTDMTQERRIIGRAARIPLLDEPEAVISMDLVKARPREGIDRSFLYCWLRYSDFGIRAAQHANGANVLHLSPKAIVDLPFVLPPSNSQVEFGRTVEPFFAQTEVLAVAERRLSASRDLLLPRLISGQLSVTDAERQLEEAA